MGEVMVMTSMKNTLEGLGKIKVNYRKRIRSLLMRNRHL